jgi:hypothetical protein
LWPRVLSPHHLSSRERLLRTPNPPFPSSAGGAHLVLKALVVDDHAASSSIVGDRKIVECRIFTRRHLDPCAALRSNGSTRPQRSLRRDRGWSQKTLSQAKKEDG